MEDFEAGKVQERLNKEFENSGYIGEVLEVTITNYKEAHKFLEQISRYAVALHLLSRYNRNVYTSRLSLIVRVNVVLNRTVIVDSDWRFDNLCGSHPQSVSELYHVNWWYYTPGFDLIGYVAMLLVVCQLSRDVIGYEDS